MITNLTRCCTRRFLLRALCVFILSGRCNPDQGLPVQVREKHRALLAQHHERFHPVWGQLLKTGYQNSRFAHQVRLHSAGAGIWAFWFRSSRYANQLGLHMAGRSLLYLARLSARCSCTQPCNPRAPLCNPVPPCVSVLRAEHW